MHYKCTTPRRIGVGPTHVRPPNVPRSCALVVILAFPISLLKEKGKVLVHEKYTREPNTL
jgi:hypothetical protein